MIRWKQRHAEVTTRKGELDPNHFTYDDMLHVWGPRLMGARVDTEESDGSLDEPGRVGGR